jgi:hypothetical protein
MFFNRDGDNGDIRGGVGLFYKSGKNIFGNVGRVVGGARDNDNYGDYDNCLVEGFDKASNQLARDLALGRAAGDQRAGEGQWQRDGGSMMGRRVAATTTTTGVDLVASPVNLRGCRQMTIFVVGVVECAAVVAAVARGVGG